MSQKIKAQRLIRSFEKHEGLNPDRDEDVVRTEIEAEEKKGPGNTARLAAMFGEVQVGHVKQRRGSLSSRSRDSSSDNETRRTTKVTKVVRRRGSRSDSDSGRGATVTKVTRTVITTRRGSSSDSDREAGVIRREKINRDSPENRRSQFIIRAAQVERGSSEEREEARAMEVKRVSRVQKRDSSDDQTVTTVTVVKKTTKVERRDSRDEREVQVVKRVSRIARRDSSSESESRGKVTVVKAKRGEQRDSSDERTARKEAKRVSKVVSRDSSDERKTKKEVKVIKKTTKVETRDSSEERRTKKEVKVIKKTTKVERRDSSEERRTRKEAKRTSKAVHKESSDEREQKKEVKVVKVSKVVRRDSSASDSEDERKHKRIEKKVTKKVRDQSSSSEDEVQTQTIKKVKVTKVTKVERQDSDSEDERIVVKKARKITKKVESDSDDDRRLKKEVKIIKKKTGSDSDDDRRLKKEVKIIKKKTGSDSDDDRARKEVKIVKVTKVVKVDSSDSSEAETTTYVVNKTEVTHVEVDKRHLRNKNVLVVFAHVFKESYEGALVGAAVKALKEQGADVQISNLFEMGFNPIASPQDFGGFVADTEFYSYSLLAGQAKAHGKLAQDVVSEQDKIEWADMILIVSQLQSHGLPALLKGWFDRIMTYNFAFSDGHMYEKGRLRGKKALLCLTSEALSSMYTPRGIHGDLNVYLWPILNGLLRFAGFDVLKPQVYFGVGRASNDYRETVINSFNRRVHGIWDEKPLSFISVDRFYDKRGYTLSDRSMEELSKAKRLTVGQYAGQAHTSMAIVVEPEKRREAAEKSSKEKLRGSGVESKKPWHTLW